MEAQYKQANYILTKLISYGFSDATFRKSYLKQADLVMPGAGG